VSYHPQGVMLAQDEQAPQEILLVCGDKNLRELLRSLFDSNGYVVEIIDEGNLVCDLVARRDFDLVVLKHPVPGRSGLEVCRDIRAEGGQIPILMLTETAEILEKVVALKLGADDYVTGPHEPLELLARVEALVRRGRWTAKPKATPVRLGETVVDFSRTQVSRNGQTIPVSAKELQLLRYFVEHRGQTLRREELLREVWGINFASATRTLDVHVVALRQKIEDDPKRPRWITTVHGIGYQFRE
jgi:two-component system, OmpR family, alkaline phosphatase synthesis response regulator PhoP